jgi:hypothetical protein
MPQPTYLSSLSQPVTPAFGQFNPNFIFGHESPQYKNDSSQYILSTQAHSEYAFPEAYPDYPLGMPTSPMTKQKTFQFSHTTPADFSENELRPENRQLVGTSYKAPFTDSGYASLPNLNHPSHVPATLEKLKSPANTEPSTTINDIDREDAKTSYSAATTVGPAHAQIYISELCSDVYSKLRPSFDARLWSTLSEALPGLIKAFAIKIGYNSSAQVNQDIMYFIHKRHE